MAETLTGQQEAVIAALVDGKTQRAAAVSGLWLHGGDGGLSHRVASS